MGYHRITIGFEYEIRVHHFGGPKIVWVFGGYAGYGSSQVWVMTGSTVVRADEGKIY